MNEEGEMFFCDSVYEYQQVQMQCSDGFDLPPVRFLNEPWSRRKYGTSDMLMTHVGPVRVCDYDSQLHGPWPDMEVDSDESQPVSRAVTCTTKAQITKTRKMKSSSTLLHGCSMETYTTKNQYDDLRENANEKQNVDGEQ